MSMKYWHKIPLYLLVLSSLIGCEQKTKPTFSDWYQSDNNEQNSSKVYEAIFHSSPLPIDTIYRSMQGPYEIKVVKLEAEGEELLWVKGYQTRLKNKDLSADYSNEFMCHNNLNYSAKEGIPWLVKTSGKNSRIFTLSEGQEELLFPEGFGIPVPEGQSFHMVSQVLNHNFKDTNLLIKHEAKLLYSKSSEAPNTIPLYQQSVFITQQTSGPAGEHGLPLLCVAHHLDSTAIAGEKPNHNCEIDYSGGDYDPYKDQHGRQYTGHWKLPYGRSELSTNVTRMLDLDNATRIHSIGVHLHPFAVSLALWDITIDSLLYEAQAEAYDHRLGFKHIDYYSNKEGIAVYPDHQYELRSVYNCTDSSTTHTAMAVMYLYLRDQ